MQPACAHNDRVESKQNEQLAFDEEDEQSSKGGDDV
jgi:hypothetical protein